MKNYKITHRATGRTLFEGRFSSLRACLEQAVRDQVSLAGANLAKANLVNANLDEADLRNAGFSGANLMGANLSEARLDHADFTNAALQNTCLCFSSLNHCDFRGALFGATDIAGCDISHSTFSTLSAFTLNFTDAATMNGCIFEAEPDKPCAMGRPPVVIHGLNHPVIFLDNHIRVGSLCAGYADLMQYVNDNLPASRLCSGTIHVFARRHGVLLKTLVREFRS